MQETLTQTAANANETPGQRLLHMKVDRRILVITLSLMAIGISLVLSSSSFFAGGKFGDQFALMRNHAVRSFIALVVMFVASRIDYRVYRKAAPALLVLSVLMMLALFFLGVSIRDTRRWMILPLINTTLQPSELARTALVFFLAYWMTRTGKDLTRFKTGFLPAAGAIALVAGICAALPNFAAFSSVARQVDDLVVV
ncbi:MAG TPA: FtsW/RodA/SpoVE family cell cycle protein, partial [Candidatus Krumholzibacteria bacterium]|nr:FtsW/RodA/SpoVE family cell cycle protein [Candidatus Krumholzibacteria bacterium]